MADDSLAPSHATGNQSIDHGSSTTQNGPSPSPFGREAARISADYLRRIAPESKALLTATTHEGATGPSSQAWDSFLQVCNYDRDSKDLPARAGERQLDIIDRNDEELGQPHLERLHALVGHLYIKLATATDEQKSLVKSTWRAISVDKKTEILRKSCQDEVNRVRSRIEENLVRFRWHDMNEEDLLEDDNFLILLDSRSQHAPDEFMHFDADMLRFLASTGVTPYRVFTQPGDTISQKQWVLTGCFKTFAEPYSDIHLPDDCAVFSGEYLEVLERQFHILTFLSSANNLILEESSKIGSADTAPPSLPSSTQSERTCTDDWRLSLVYPYLPPTVDNLDMCSKLIQTRLDEARDLLFGIQMLLDKKGDRSIGPNSLGTQGSFRDKSVAEAIVATFKEAFGHERSGFGGARFGYFDHRAPAADRERKGAHCDQHVDEHCSPHIVEVWKSLWPRKEDLRRTQDWKDTETAPLVGHLAAVNLSFGDEEKAPASEVPRPSKKSKKKKRKAQIPEPGNIEDPRPNRDEDGTTQPEKPRISVSKRAWEVFHDGLWFVPKEKKKPAELRWQDFLHATTSLGFNATKMFGSVWRFEAGERAQSAGLERSINFHEPHENTTKLGPWKARRYGRRLTRVYGIDMSSLFAGK
ncbi:hypothetical protein LA080_001432 [Diaporthe eres]|nr:hypothetical protein LA080_001432 [Diaporthe eres]